MVFVITTTLAPAWAFDVGAPLALVDEKATANGAASQNRLELFYESYDRTVLVETDSFVFGPIGGAPTGSGTLPDLEDDLEGGFLVGRWTRHVSPSVSTQFDLGITGLGDSRDTGLLLAFATRWRLGSTGPIAYTAQVGINYVTEAGSDQESIDEDGELVTGFEEFDLLEYGGALLASTVLVENATSRTTLYTGPRVTGLRGDYHAQLDFVDIDRRALVDGTIRESSVFGWVLGVNADVTPTVGFRVEARLIDETSLSAGASTAF